MGVCKEAGAPNASSRPKGRLASTATRQKRLVAFAVHALAHQLAMPADGLGPLAGPALGRLLVVAAHFHFPEDAFALHLLLQRAQGLIDVVVADEYLQDASASSTAIEMGSGSDTRRAR